MKLVDPKPGTQFVLHEGRLSLFHTAESHMDYWRGYWTANSPSELVSAGRSGDVGEFQPLLNRYAPRELPFLEAGCGPGHLVAAMAARGYMASGVDYEPEVVSYVNRTHPDLEVREGNVLCLAEPDGSVGTYMSVGVIEHFEDGPRAALAEARRVLNPRGIALISVPYLNPARRAHMAKVPSLPAPGMSFHQYYFDIPAMQELLAEARLELIDAYPYAVAAFLTREHPIVVRFWDSDFAKESLKMRLRARFRGASQGLRSRCGHMVMTVSRPIK